MKGAVLQRLWYGCPDFTESIGIALMPEASKRVGRD